MNTSTIFNKTLKDTNSDGRQKDKKDSKESHASA